MKFPVKLNPHITSVEFSQGKDFVTLQLSDGKVLSGALDESSPEMPPKRFTFTLNLQRPIHLDSHQDVVDGVEVYVFGDLRS